MYCRVWGSRVSLDGWSYSLCEVRDECHCGQRLQVSSDPSPAYGSRRTVKHTETFTTHGLICTALVTCCCPNKPSPSASHHMTGPWKHPANKPCQPKNHSWTDLLPPVPMLLIVMIAILTLKARSSFIDSPIKSNHRMGRCVDDGSHYSFDWLGFMYWFSYCYFTL